MTKIKKGKNVFYIYADSLGPRICFRHYLVKMCHAKLAKINVKVKMKVTNAATKCTVRR